MSIETTEMEREELLSLETAAEFLCVSKSTMYRLLDQGKLRGMKAGKQWRFRKEDLLDYMQRGPAALALANLPISVIDGELDFFAEELTRAGSATEQFDDPSLDGEAGKIAQLVRRMVGLLYTRKGSDLHLEPVWVDGVAESVLRLRVDGALCEVRRLPVALHPALIMEWKRVSRLDTEERTRPQDGNAQFVFGEKQARLRISLVPTMYGEKIAIRTIPMNIPSMEALGIDKTALHEWIQQWRGLILVVGPTGSGKVTTTVACVGDRRATGANILTVEDPIEYVIPGVTQLQVEGFPRLEGLRAVYKQDPDIIYVGHLSGDPEYAQVTVDFADTGHLMLGVMHAHDAISPLYAFAEWGVKRSLLAANLIGCVCQSLMLKLCPQCKQPVEVEPEQRARIRDAALAGGYTLAEDAVFYGKGTGCTACNGAGAGGRFALHEYFTFTPETRAAFVAGATAEELLPLAIQGGMRTYFAEVVHRAVEDGLLSLDDVLRRLPR